MIVPNRIRFILKNYVRINNYVHTILQYLKYYDIKYIEKFYDVKICLKGFNMAVSTC